MPNDRNVAAIVAALAASVDDIRIAAYGSPEEWEIADVSLLDVARALASRGVLVPSALTVEQVAALYDVPEGEDYRAYRVRDLEQVATGEWERKHGWLTKGES